MGTAYLKLVDSESSLYWQVFLLKKKKNNTPLGQLQREIWKHNVCLGELQCGDKTDWQRGQQRTVFNVTAFVLRHGEKVIQINKQTNTKSTLSYASIVGIYPEIIKLERDFVLGP